MALNQTTTIKLNHNFVRTSDITHQDVLLGKGALCAGHVGTIAFKVIVQSRLDTYNKANQTTRNDKTRLTLQVLDLILTTGGRFLRKEHEASSDLWYELNKAEARVKVRDAFRDCVKNVKNKRRPSALLDKIGLTKLFDEHSTYMEVVDHVASSSDIRDFICSRNDLIEQRKQRRSSQFLQQNASDHLSLPFASSSVGLMSAMNTDTVAPSYASTALASNTLHDMVQQELVSNLFLRNEGGYPPQVCQQDRQLGAMLLPRTINRELQGAEQADAAVTTIAPPTTTYYPQQKDPTKQSYDDFMLCNEKYETSFSSLTSHTTYDNLLTPNSVDADKQLPPLGSLCSFSRPVLLHQAEMEGHVAIKTPNTDEENHVMTFDGIATVESSRQEDQDHLMDLGSWCSSIDDRNHYSIQQDTQEEDWLSFISNDDCSISKALERAVHLADEESDEIELIMNLDRGINAHSTSFSNAAANRDDGAILHRDKHKDAKNIVSIGDAGGFRTTFISL